MLQSLPIKHFPVPAILTVIHTLNLFDDLSKQKFVYSAPEALSTLKDKQYGRKR